MRRVLHRSGDHFGERRGREPDRETSSMSKFQWICQQRASTPASHHQRHRSQLGYPSQLDAARGADGQCARMHQDFFDQVYSCVTA